MSQLGSFCSLLNSRLSMVLTSMRAVSVSRGCALTGTMILSGTKRQHGMIAFVHGLATERLHSPHRIMKGSFAQMDSDWGNWTENPVDGTQHLVPGIAGRRVETDETEVEAQDVVFDVTQIDGHEVLAAQLIFGNDLASEILKHYRKVDQPTAAYCPFDDFARYFMERGEK